MQRKNFRVFKCDKCGEINILYCGTDEELLEEFPEVYKKDGKLLLNHSEYVSCDGICYIVNHEELPSDIMVTILDSIEEDNNHHRRNSGRNIANAMEAAGIEDSKITATLIHFTDDYVERMNI